MPSRSVRYKVVPEASSRPRRRGDGCPYRLRRPTETTDTCGATVTSAPKRLTAMPAAKANAAVATVGNDLITIASGRDHASVLCPASFEQFTLIAVGEPAALLAILLQEPVT